MRQLSDALLAEQKKPLRKPLIKLEVQAYGHPQASSAIQWQTFGWQKLYQGSEPYAWHDCCISGDGSLHRVRLEGTAIKYSRVTNPAPNSDFSQWSTGSSWGATASSGRVAIAASGSEVICASMDAANLYYRRSTDNGETWGSWMQMSNARPCERGVAVAFKPNGDCAIVHASDVNDPYSLYIQKRTGGTWSSGLGQRAGDYNIQDLTMYYDGDWNIIALVLEGSHVSVVRMVHGDGYRVTAGQWATDVKIGLGRARVDIASQVALRQFETQWRYGALARKTPTWWEQQQAVMEALAGEALDLSGPFIHKPTDYVAVLSLSRQNQPWVFRLRPGTDFYDFNWNKASILDTYAPRGLALASSSTHLWGTTPDQVWRTELPSYWQPPQAGSGAGSKITIPLSKIFRITESVDPEQPSALTVDLDNSTGTFDSPGSGDLSALKRGSRVNLHIGYRTQQGDKLSEAGRYFIESYEYRRAPNISSFTLHCTDAWGLLQAYRFNKPVEWNIASDQFTCYDLIEKVVKSVGGTLSYKSRSNLITSLYPRLEVRPGESAASVLRRLLSLVPDVIYFFGLEGYIVYPQANDTPVYLYKFPAT